MKKILFVCHGNICRSPMAEFIFKDMVAKYGVTNDFHICSAATSSEEIGNSVYPPAVYELSLHGISVKGKRAVRITRDDYLYFDMIIVMENYNIRNLRETIGCDPYNKVWKLLDFENPDAVEQCTGDDISDPWYHGNFSLTYNEIAKGCAGLLKFMGYR